MRRLVSLVAITIFVSLEFAYSQPSWVKSRASTTFPENFYMIGIGFANKTNDRAADLQKAYDAAFADIAKQIKSNVASESSVQEYEVLSENKNSLEQRASAEIKVTTDVKLGGLRIADTYEDDDNNLIWALAVLNRISAGNQLKETLTGYLTEYKRDMETSKERTRSGDLYQAMSSLTEVLRNQIRYNSLLPLYTFITNPLAASDSSFVMPGVLLTGDARAVVQSYFSNLIIEKVSGDTQSVSIKGEIKPLVVRAIFGSSQSRTPVSGLKVEFAFRNGDGKLTESSMTDKSGMATCDIATLSAYRAGIYTVAATTDLSEFKLNDVKSGEDEVQNWNNFLDRNYIETLFTLKRSSGSVDDRLAEGMANLCGSITDSTASIVTSKILFQDKLPGPMAEFLRQKIELALQSSTKFSVISQEAVRNSQIQLSNEGYQNMAQPDYASQAAGAKYVVSGSYWQNVDKIDLNLKIVDVNTHVLAGTASLDIPLSWLPKLSLAPENYSPVVDDNIIKNERKGEELKIDVWVDRLDGLYHEGDTVSIYVRSNEDCFAQLVYNDAGGNAVMVFPNKVDWNSKLRGGLTYKVPGLFKVVPPFGREILKAYASDTQVSVPRGEEFNGLVILKSVDDFQKSVRAAGRSGNSYAESSTVITTMPR